MPLDEDSRGDAPEGSEGDGKGPPGAKSKGPGGATWSRRSLRVNVSWSFLGNSVNSAASWLLIVLLVKLTSPETVGHFAYAWALSLPIFTLANLQLRHIQVTDSSVSYSFQEYLALRLISSPVAFLAICGFAFYHGVDTELGLAIILVASLHAADSISELFFGLFGQRERLDLVAKSLLIRGPCTLLAMSLVLYPTRSLAYALVANLIVRWSIVVFFDATNARRLLAESGAAGRERASLQPEWTQSRMRSLFVLALPLGTAVGMGMLLRNIPRYSIEGALGAHELGIFAAVAALVAVGTTVVMAVGLSATPRVAREFAEERFAQVRALLYKLLAIGLLIGVASILVAFVLGEWALGVLYRPEYAAHAHVLTLMMVYATADYLTQTTGIALTAMRRFTVQAKFQTLQVVIMSILCLTLIPRFGLEGAAYAMILSRSLGFVVYSVLAYKYLLEAEAAVSSRDPAAAG